MSHDDWAFLLKYGGWVLGTLVLLIVQRGMEKRREKMYKLLDGVPWQSKEWRML
jgi:hypothetical protein